MPYHQYTYDNGETISRFRSMKAAYAFCTANNIAASEVTNSFNGKGYHVIAKLS